MRTNSRTLLALASAWLIFAMNDTSVYAQSAPGTPGAPPDAGAAGNPSSQNYNIDNGTQVIDAGSLNNISNLTIAPGATALIDFGTQSNLLFSGNIANSGNIYAFSSNSQVTSANIAALNIFNNQGGVLSSVLPSQSSLSALAGFSNLASVLNLNLSAVQQIVNGGTISSSGSLAMAAGTGITNTGTMSAVNNLSALVGSAGLVNMGTITSLAGNINIATMTAQNLMFNNTNGSVQALLGNINVNTGATTEKLLMNIIGGDFISNQLNLTNLNGTIEANIGDVTGAMNISTGIAHIQAAASDMKLGTLNITGDPTFYNTGIADGVGNITITSDIDLRPVNFTAPGSVALAIVANGSITAQAGVTSITVSSAPNNINSLNYPGNNNGGSILIVAGATFTSSTDNSSGTASAPAPPAPYPPGPGNTADTLTITGGSAGGGSINLANVNLNSQAGQASTPALAGDVILAAFGGTTHSGDISVGNITTGEASSPAPANDVSGINGNVYIVGSGNITTGVINSSGNIQSSSLYSGNVTIASATPMMVQSTTNSNSWAPVFATTNTTLIPAGSTTFQVANPAGISNGQTLYLDALGSNAETVVVSTISGTTVTLNAPLVKDHVITERIYQAATSVIVNPGAGAVGTTPVTQNGGNFAPNMAALQSGTISTGQITAGGNIAISTNGTVNVGGSMSLTQNPTTAPPSGTAYVRYPSINILGGTAISIGAGYTVSSEIASCTFCFNNVNLDTQALTVASTAGITGYVVTVKSPATQSLALVNNGTITGGATNGGAAINAFVNIQSSSGLTLSGTGTIQTPGVVSVILLAAADGQTFSLASSHNFSLGTQGLVIFNAQKSGGQINVASAAAINFGATNNPMVLINTPSLTLNTTSNLYNAGTMAISSGLAFSTADGVTPLDLTITVPDGASASLNANIINVQPLHNANLNLATTGTSTLNTTGSVVFATSGTGKVNVTTGFTITGSYIKVSNLSGGIRGVAFQPLVGPFVNSTNGWTAAASYSYQQVLALLAPIAASGQFQVVSTYTDIAQAVAPYWSTQYVIPAAKDAGLRVSAGVFVTFDTSGNITSPVDASGNPIDLAPTLAAAAKYGNVMDLVIGNEDIVGGANPENSIAALTTLITTVKGLRNGTTNPITGAAFNSTNLPVTTRQVGGVYDIVNPSFGNATATTNMVTLLQTVEGYAYGNFYPFFDENVIAALTCSTCTFGAGGYAYPYIGMSATKAQFTSLVQTNMSAQYNKVAGDVKTYVTSSTPTIKIGETGWANQGITQATPAYAEYYYSAMQGWSATTTDPVTNTTGVPVFAYFESYNEPNKPTDKGPPSGGTVTLTANVSPGATQLPVSASAPFAGVSQIVIYPPPQRVVPPNNPPPYVPVAPPEEFANIQAANGSTPANTLVLFSPIQTAHNSGDIVNIGQGGEPYFGLWVANGTSPGAPGYAAVNTYVLNSITQQITLPQYGLSALPPQPVTPVVQTTTTTMPTVSADVTLALATAMSQAQINLSRAPGTILPTDINPQAPPANAFQQMNAGQQSTVTLAGTQLNGNIAFFGSADNQQSLFSGNGLFSPKQDMLVQTSLGSVQIGADSVVLVLQNEHGMSIFNFHDSQTGDVKVAVNGQSVTLAPGQQLFVTKDTNAKFDDINKTGIGTRNVSETTAGDAKLFQTEFSMTAALTKLPALKQLVHSSDKKDRAKASKILKTAAAMSIVGQNKSPFKGR